MYLKGGSGETAAASGDQTNSSAPSSGETGGGHSHAHGPLDLQQIVQRAPSFAIADLKKGDALTILFSTQNEVCLAGITAIQLVAGVEPILRASPKGGQGMVLSPWSLGGGGGDAENQ